MKRFSLTSECHVIERTGRSGAASHIAYFPLKSIAVGVNRQAAEVIGNLKRRPGHVPARGGLKFLNMLTELGLVNGPPDPPMARPLPLAPRPTRTLLLLSERCPLACVYCYGASSTRGARMPWPVARAAIDLIVRNAQAQKRTQVELGFHGGGEPTTHWSVLTRSVTYARRLCKSAGLRLSTSLCTNGIFSIIKAQWLARNIDGITVSFDGPPQIQNAQRPTAAGHASFALAARTLKEFDRLGKNYGFRVTATESIQDRIGEVYDYATTRFKPRQFCIEPLFVCGRCATTLCRPPAAESFVKGVTRIMDTAVSRGVEIQYSGGRLFHLGTTFCGASRDNFFVTLQGLVTSCIEVSKEADPRSNVFIYGRYQPDSRLFSFNTARYRRLIKLHVDALESCRDCFARWHCAGDCLAKAPDMRALTRRRNEYRCEINKAITLHQLEHEMKPSGSRRKAYGRKKNA